MSFSRQTNPFIILMWKLRPRGVNSLVQIHSDNRRLYMGQIFVPNRRIMTE